MLDIHQKELLLRLPIASGAAFDSHAQDHNRTCLPNTRVNLLQHINNWAHNKQSKSIFWLNGMAGTGKSTISRTIAQTFSSLGSLGASFFFNRGEHDRQCLVKFFTTLAADIAIRQRATATFIKSNLDSDPFVVSKSVRDQFDKLFYEPIRKANITDRIILFVIDALDECDRDEDIRLIIYLFSLVQQQGGGHIKVFFTSRPELPPRLGFKAIDGKYQDFILHDVPHDIIENDISIFIRHEFAQIRHDFNATVTQDRQLDDTWPDKRNIEALIKATIPLFIFAATICRFVSDRRLGHPKELLRSILDFQSGSAAAELDQLDATYKPVLNRLITGLSATRRNMVIEEFRRIIGPIMVLAIPLSSYTLAKLLLIPYEVINNRLDMLHSVLQVPENPTSPIRLLHLSFRDFLVDPNKETHPFWLDEKMLHGEMASKCLDVLKAHLKQDICGLQRPDTARISINPNIINQKIPPELQYASLYWTFHIKRADIRLQDGSIYHAFLTQYLLYWIEVLSLKGHLSLGITLINTLKSCIEVGKYFLFYLSTYIYIYISSILIKSF